MDYTKNKKYFSNNGCLTTLAGVFAWFAMYTLFFVIITAMVSMFKDKPDADTMAAGSVTAIIISSVLMYFIVKASKKRKFTDENYDACVKEYIKEMEQKALDKLGIDKEEVKEIDPIIIDGYNYEQCTLFKKGKDGVWRTNVYKVIYLFFSQNEVHSYTCEFCTTDEQKKESTDVYFYQDIVSASTESSTATFENEKIQYESFKLTTSGGTSLIVSIRDSSHAQRSISAMRQLLRAKKVS